jgi:two-component system OmpR family response regulator
MIATVHRQALDMFASTASAPASAPNLLIVDDDAGLRAEIGDYLRQHGYGVHTAENAAAMEKVLAVESIQLIVLDVMMPGEDGLSICRRLSEGDGPPIVIMSAMGEEIDRIVGLELGADDYLAKPCSPRELLARVRSVLRRGEDRPRKSSGYSYEFSGFHLDVVRRQLYAPAGVAVLLTEGEFALLTSFIEKPGQILTRDELIERARGSESEVFDRAIDVQVSRLRRKLSVAGQGEIIRTIRGAGYMFDAKVKRR